MGREASSNAAVMRQLYQSKMLVRVAAVLAAARDAEGVFKTVESQGTALLEAEQIALYVVGDHHRKLQRSGHAGGGDEDADEEDQESDPSRSSGGRSLWSVSATAADGRGQVRIPEGQGVVGAVVESGGAILLPHTAAVQDAGLHPAEITRLHSTSIDNMLCLPARDAEGNVIAVLQVVNKGNTGFDDDDIATGESLAGHVAAALQRCAHNATTSTRMQVAAAKVRSLQTQCSRAADELERAAEHTHQLVAMASDNSRLLVSARMELDQLFALVPTLTLRAVAADAAVLWVYDRDRREFWTGSANLGRRFQRFAAPAAGDEAAAAVAAPATACAQLVAQVAASGQAAMADQRSSDAQLRGDVGAALCVPVFGMAGQTVKPVAVLEVVRQRGRHSATDARSVFTRQDTETAALVATQVSLGLEACGLVTQLRGSLETMEEHLAGAHEDLEAAVAAEHVASTLQRLSVELALCRTYSQLCATVQVHAVEAVQATAGGVYLVDRARSRLWTVRASQDGASEPDVDDSAERTVFLNMGAGLTGQAAASGQLATGAGTVDEVVPVTMEGRWALGTPRLVAVPVRDGSGVVVAVLQMANKQYEDGTGDFSEQDTALLQQLGGAIVAAIARCGEVRTWQQQAASLQATQDAVYSHDNAANLALKLVEGNTAIVRDGVTPDSLANLVNRAIQSAWQSRGISPVSVYMLDDDTGDLVGASDAHGLAPRIAPGADPVLTRAVASREVVEEAAQPPTRPAQLAMPVEGLDGNIVAVLHATNSSAEGFDDERVALLQVVAQHLQTVVSARVVNTRLAATTAQLQATQAALSEMNAAATSAQLSNRLTDGVMEVLVPMSECTTVDELQAVVKVALPRTLDAHTARLYLMDKSGTELWTAADADDDTGAGSAEPESPRRGSATASRRHRHSRRHRGRSRVRVPLGVGRVGQAAQSGRVVLAGESMQQGDEGGGGGGAGSAQVIKRSCCVPVKAAETGAVVGVLEVVHVVRRVTNSHMASPQEQAADAERDARTEQCLRRVAEYVHHSLERCKVQGEARTEARRKEVEVHAVTPRVLSSCCRVSHACGCYALVTHRLRL